MLLHGRNDRDVCISLLLFDQLSIPLRTLLIDLSHLSEEAASISIEVFLGTLLVPFGLNIVQGGTLQLILALNL